MVQAVGLEEAEEWREGGRACERSYWDDPSSWSAARKHTRANKYSRRRGNRVGKTNQAMLTDISHMTPVNSVIGQQRFLVSVNAVSLGNGSTSSCHAAASQRAAGPGDRVAPRTNGGEAPEHERRAAAAGPPICSREQKRKRATADGSRDNV